MGSGDSHISEPDCSIGKEASRAPAIYADKEGAVQRLVRAIDSQNPETADRIVSEILRIQSEIESISRLSCVLSGFAKEVFEQRDAMERVRSWDKGMDMRGEDAAAWADQKSSVMLRGANPMGYDDIQFLYASKAMDFIFVPAIQYDPNIEFLYVINERGVSRGYPKKDFSVLPPGFDATKQTFFYIADEQHNPERKERWTEPYLCPLTKMWMVTCASPIYQSDTFKGVVGIDVNLGRIIKGLTRILSDTNDGYAFLVSPHGNLIISSDVGMNSLTNDKIVLVERWTERNSKGQRLTDNIQSGEITLTSGKVYFLYNHFSANEWDLFCVLPKTSKGSPSQTLVRSECDALQSDDASRDRSYQPLMSFVSSFNQSLKQIEKLIEGTTIIGRGMLNHRITVERKDEMGLLAISINKMAEELKKRKDEVEAAYQKISQMDRLSALGRLTAGIAHEINNPLGIISNYIQILARDDRLPEEIREDIRMIEEEIQRASEIIKGLLNFSGQTGSEKRMIQINEVLQKTIGLVRLQLKSQRSVLVEHYDEECPPVVGNATSLQQALLNIMLNGLEAMGKEGRMEVGTRYRKGKGRNAKKDSIEVSITDSGHGIEKKVLDKIFDPFFTLKQQGRGTGLGLSISYGIIREHSGSIYVRSALRKGTSVTITLPVRSQILDARDDQDILRTANRETVSLKRRGVRDD